MEHFLPIVFETYVSNVSLERQFYFRKLCTENFSKLCKIEHKAVHHAVILIEFHLQLYHLD